MRVAELHIENFRGVECATLDCGSQTVLVGRNGAGKSTFLQALQLFYKLDATVTSEDFNHRRTDTPLVIRVTFEDLHAEELDAFKAYIDGSKLTVTKRFDSPGSGGTSGGHYYASMRRYARFGDARKLGARDKAKATNELAKTLQDEGLLEQLSVIRSEADADSFMAGFEAAHPDLLVLQEGVCQFFGEKNVGGGKLDNYTKFVYVPAVRDAQQETGGKGSFAQLLELAVLRRVNALPQVASLQEQLKKIVSETFEPKEVKESLIDLEKDINDVLQPFIPSASLSLDWDGDPKVNYEPPRINPSLTEDAFKGEISRKGHGLQRALVFALLAHLARVRSAQVRVVESTPPNDGPEVSPPSTTVL
jgi:putative ATP-dependent endonuclease of OLD family